MDHCPDRSDEALCVFQCANGRTAGSAARCNGVVVCADASDEASCVSPPTRYRCVDRTFIQLGKRSDLHGDCPDDRDETRCVSESILPCDGDLHVFDRAAEHCDAVVHCPSGADELDCPSPAA